MVGTGEHLIGTGRNLSRHERRFWLAGVEPLVRKAELVVITWEALGRSGWNSWLAQRERLVNTEQLLLRIGGTLSQEGVTLGQHE